MNTKLHTTTTTLTIAALAGLALLSGCEKKKAPPPPAPVVDLPPPPPPAPDPVTIDTILKSEKADPRLQFPQDVAPVDESLAKSIIRFTTALAKGDAASFKPMLSTSGQSTFDTLSASGEWDDATGKITGVRVVRILDNAPSGGQEMTDATVYLAVQEQGSAYLLGWSALKQGTGWKFNGSASTNAAKARASDFANLSDAELEGKTNVSSFSGSAGAVSPGGSGEVSQVASVSGLPGVGTTPAPTEPAKEPEIARESGDPKIPRPMQLFLHSQLATRLLARAPQGAPLESEVINGLSLKYKVDQPTMTAYLDRGREDANAGKKLPNRELYLWAQEAIKAWKSNTSVEISIEEFLLNASRFTQRKVEDLTAEYEAGAKEK